MKLHVTTRIHGRKHLYNASVYGDIYRYICGGLGVVISQLHAKNCLHIHLNF